MIKSKYSKTAIKAKGRPETGLNEDEVETLGLIVKKEISNCEKVLDEKVREVISENYEYYTRKLPKPSSTGVSFVDNTCEATVTHFVSQAKDAFLAGDLLEVVPDSSNDAFAIKVATELVNDVLDRENNRTRLFTDMFKDAAIAKVGILKPYVFEDNKVGKRYFSDITDDELTVLSAQLEEQGYEDVQEVITDTVAESFEEVNPLTGMVMSGSSEKLTGYVQYKKPNKVIKIEPVPPENFLINVDARDVKSARCVGHKNDVTISELLGMGFAYDKVAEVAEKDEDGDDIDQNIATISRQKMDSGDEDTTIDKSMREVTLYELYLRTTLTDASDDSADYAEAKLYQVFYSQGVVLDCQEYNEAPYACAVFDPVSHSFWGNSYVDKVKHIQRSKTGLIRQTMEYNQLQTTPRFLYKGVDERSMLSKLPGSGIKVTEPDGYVTPLQIGNISGETGNILSLLDSQREQATGITFTGQGLLGDILKAGGSAISASMVLSEGQMVIKDAINNMLESGIKPLCSIIYNMIRENFDTYQVEVDGQMIEFSPMNEMPELKSVRIKCPLGTNARLEKANAYQDMLNQLMAPEAEQFRDPVRVSNLFKRVYEYQDIKDVADYIRTEEEISMNDAMVQQMTQLTSAMEQMQAQLQQMTAKNTQLEGLANELAVQELQLKEREVVIKENEAAARGTMGADKQELEERKLQFLEEKGADEVDIKRREVELKEAQTAFEMANPDDNAFRI